MLVQHQRIQILTRARARAQTHPPQVHWELETVPPPVNKAVTREAPPPPPTATAPQYRIAYSGRYDLKPRDKERIQTPQFQISYPTNMPRSSKKEKV